MMAGLLIKGVIQLSVVDLAYDTDDIFTARVRLPDRAYPDLESRLRFHRRLLTGLQAVAGVASVGLADNLPPLHAGAWYIEVEGTTYERDEDFVAVRRGVATTDYFRTFGVSVVQGRGFTSADRSDTLPVALVNSSFARDFFPDGDVIGRRIRLAAGPEQPPEPWLTVVGVVPDLKAFPLGADGVDQTAQNPAAFYIPMAQAHMGTFITIVLRTQETPMAMTARIQEVVASIDPELALFSVLPLEAVIYAMVWFYPVLGTLFMVFGGGALFLAAIGLYVGLSLALLATAPLPLMLFDVAPRDPAVFGLVLLTLAATGFLASFLPARRTAKIDPAAALGSE